MKNLVVTGANRGIGLELVKQSLAAGDRVFAGCRRPHQAETLQALCKDYPDTLIIAPLDVTSEASINHFVDCIQGFTIDVLINNAGIYGPSHRLVQVWRNLPGQLLMILKRKTGYRFFRLMPLRHSWCGLYYP